MSQRPELLLARDARVRYDLAASESWALSGWTDLQTARAVAQALNADRDLTHHPEQGVRAGHVHALGLVHAHWQRLLDDYRQEHGAGCFRAALAWLEGQFGPTTIRAMLTAFRDLFEDPDALSNSDPSEDSTPVESAMTHDGSHPGLAPDQALESILLLWLVHENPATEPLRDLFLDDALEARTGYRRMIGSLQSFFSQQPPATADHSLFEALLAPATAAPTSLGDQLTEVLALEHPISTASRRHLQLGLDILREEERPVFVGPGGDPTPPPPPEAHDFSDLASEAARFSDDHAWMAELVLVAKNALVWLDQLSRTYDQPIRRLDEIPDDALARLARRGFTGLWLIGIWQRSEASARIKQRSGQPAAGASAYAIHDYVVAEALGGDDAADVLAARARRHGLRLACDMVPNHMGLDARWVAEAPEHFVQTDRCPYPNYTFDGPDLSSDPTVGIHLEDHYYDRSDAAVVFRRTERETGEVQYLYHGNDGTATPWNDTAQLDYLRAETREAVVEMILAVARRFPVIRFDAAMTLAKQHIQRLWHPAPGTAGDIPSRAERAVSPAEFEALVSDEFWREVVDRVAEEVPETLLLAEAFWLMEGYFVRSLGMHRVYNSAFMHMVRDEDNTKFRQTLANTLAFDPGILQRFVNFTTNPDEATAAEQFGKGDKYFAAATLMLTLPGLPLFGHGQVEGLSEKYGMEYQRARLDEQPDPGFIAHHERTLVPVMTRRRLFAGVEHFHLLDFENEAGEVIDDVYAIVNRDENQRALVLVHNRDTDVTGRVRQTVPKRPASARSSTEETEHTEPASPASAPLRIGLVDALGLEVADDLFYRLHDPHRDLDYLRASTEFGSSGFTCHLAPFAVRVLLDFTPLRDGIDGPVRRLASQLGQEGVPDLVAALRDLDLAPLLAPMRSVFALDRFERLLKASRCDPESAARQADALARGLGAALAVIAPGIGFPSANDGDDDSSVARVVKECRDLLTALHGQQPIAPESPHPLALIGWALLARIGHFDSGISNLAQAGHAMIQRGRLDRPLAALLFKAGLTDEAVHQRLAAVRLLVVHQDWHRDLGDEPASKALERMLADPDARRFLGLNTFDDAVWFNSEAFDTLCHWLSAVARLQIAAGHGTATDLDNALRAVRDLRTAEALSDYRLDRLQAAVIGPIEASE